MSAPTAPTYNMADEREAAIVRWRLRCFEGAGVEPLGASALALRRDIDRADVERLLQGGASSAEVCAIFL
jgi:hypothetical protein